MVGFVVEAAGEVLGALADVSLDSDTKRGTRRIVIFTLLTIVAVAIGIVLLLIYA